MKELFVSQRQTQREQKQHRAQAIRKAIPVLFLSWEKNSEDGLVSRIKSNKAEQVRIGRIRTEASLRDSQSILGHFRHFSRESALSGRS